MSYNSIVEYLFFCLLLKPSTRCSNTSALYSTTTSFPVPPARCFSLPTSQAFSLSILGYLCSLPPCMPHFDFQHSAFSMAILNITHVLNLIFLLFKKFLFWLYLDFIVAHRLFGALAFSSCRVSAQLSCSLWELSSLTRDQTCVPCIGRQIYNQGNLQISTRLPGKSLKFIYFFNITYHNSAYGLNFQTRTLKSLY